LQPSSVILVAIAEVSAHTSRKLLLFRRASKRLSAASRAHLRAGNHIRGITQRREAGVIVAAAKNSTDATINRRFRSM
jgi:hypothetical protein